MGLDFYYILGPSPCRSVLLTFKALNLTPNLIPVNVFELEHLKPEFIKINPQHSLPTLVDDGFVIWESRAIMTYLVNKYGNGDNALYPADPKARAVIDQRLNFDMGTIYARFAPYFYPTFRGAPRDESKIPAIDEAFRFLDKFLESSTYAAGENLTLADLALVVTVSTYEAVDYNIAQYPNVVRWYEKVKATAPGYEINEKGVEMFKTLSTQIQTGQITHPSQRK